MSIRRPTLRPTTLRICWWSMTTGASATCCRAILSGEGYRVTTADNAAEARAKLIGLHFDLLVLDVMMPGESGFELAKALRDVLRRADPDADRARRQPKAASRGSRSAPTTTCRSRSSRANCRCASDNILKRARPAAARAGGDRCASVPSSSSSTRGELRKGDEIVPSDRPRARHAAHAGGDGRARRCRAMTLAGDGRQSQRAHRRRADQPPAPQDRARTRPTRSSCRRCAASATGW